MDKAQQAARQQIADHRHKGHASAKAIQTIGQVDGVHQKDDAEKRDRIVEQAHIHKPEDRQLHLGRKQAQTVKAKHKPEGQRDLQDHLLCLGQAEVAVPDDLDKVIQKADQPRAERQKQHQQHRLHLGQAQCVGQFGAEHGPGKAQRSQNAQNKAETAHGGGAVFLVVPGGALLPDGLPKVQTVQHRDHKFARHRRDGKAADSPCRQQV